MHPKSKAVKCSHPPDKREFVFDGYRIHENGELTDNIIEKEFCSDCGTEIEQVKEEIIY